MPDVRPNGFAFELPVEKPERNGNRGEAHQRPDKIKNAVHRSPEGMVDRAAMRAPAAVPERHPCTLRAPIARGNFKRNHRRCRRLTEISKKVQASMRATAGTDFQQLSRQQGRAAAIENPPFAGAGEGFVKKKAGLVEL